MAREELCQSTGVCPMDWIVYWIQVESEKLLTQLRHWCLVSLNIGTFHSQNILSSNVVHNHLRSIARDFVGSLWPTFLELWPNVHFSILTLCNWLYLITFIHLTYSYMVSTIEPGLWDPALLIPALTLTHIWRSLVNSKIILIGCVFMMSWRLFICQMIHLMQDIQSDNNQVSLTLFNVNSDFDILHWNTLCLT